jgi:uncharacterized protein YndB with AHSA1/START domain
MEPMNMIKTILVVLAVLIAGVLAYAATRPDTFSVERHITIAAAPERIYPLIEDFHRWGEWSPYEKKDPAMRREFSGAEAGAGAIYAWDGNRDIGAGRMQITDAPPTRIVIALDFLKPFKSHSVAEFTITPVDGGSDVRWQMRGPAPYISKLMGLFFNMDRMIGSDFEVGLADLKRVAER